MQAVSFCLTTHRPGRPQSGSPWTSPHKPQPLSDQVHHTDYRGHNRFLFKISPRWMPHTFHLLEFLAIPIFQPSYTQVAHACIIPSLAQFVCES